MSKTAKNKRILSEKRNAGTQTHDIDTTLEIARLQEQVKLLNIEIDHLRQYSIEKPSIATKTTPPGTAMQFSNAIETPKSVKGRQLSQNTQSTQRKRNSMIIRGCTCKGNCATQKCGCMKKNTSCGELCKCSSSSCQNQEKNDIEQNKENLKNVEVVQVEAKQVKNKKLKNVTAHKGLFSPNTTEVSSTPNISQLIIPSVEFGSPKELFKSDSEGGTPEHISETKEEKKTTELKTKEKNSKNVTQRKDRQKNNLEVDSAPIRKLRSLSNEGKKKQNKTVTQTETLRRSNSHDMSDLTDEKLNTVDMETNNFFKNIKDGLSSLRRDIKNRHPHSEEKMPQQLAVRDPKQTDRQKKEKHNESQTDEDNFNPMKPKYELPRTPTNSKNTGDSSCVSSSSLRTPVMMQEEEEELRDPEEFGQVEVDWEKYQAQLVACSKCKRKFHPLRIKKHQACCKKT